MELCRFRPSKGDWTLGRISGDQVMSLAALGVGESMRALLETWGGRLSQLGDVDGIRYSLSEVHLGPPIDDPRKFLALGLNYKAHAAEAIAAGRTIPERQMWFNKQVSCINRPFDAIEYPSVVTKLDYEGELACVIGRECRNVMVEDALAYIAGYMICNDVSARDWQAHSPTITLGKSFDTHGPIGPWLTLADEVQDPQELDLTVTVNGEIRQHASTRDMIATVTEQISYLSTAITLEPGDIISTGTPSGVGIAIGKLLQPGDVVRVEITGLGALENLVAN